MTAEQALIKENKKDPRVRYITYNPKFKSLTFWENKPEYDEYERHFWSPSYRSHIENFNSICTEKFIICIDDILPKEEDVKLLIEPSINIFSEFLTAQTVRFLSESGIPVYDVLKNHFDVSVEVIQNMISNNEIQLRSFFIHLGSYVDKLKKEDIQEEKEQTATFIVNNRVIKTGEIKVNDGFEDSFESRFENHPMTKFLESERDESQKEQEENKPPLGLYPRKFWIESRVKAINEAIERYTEAWACIPPEWVNERNELIEQLNNL